MTKTQIWSKKTQSGQVSLALILFTIIIALLASFINWLAPVSKNPMEFTKPSEISHKSMASKNLQNKDYKSSSTCRSCHPEEYNSWQKTYHSTMTQWASKETIISDWQGKLTFQAREYKLFRKGDDFYVDMPKYGTNGDLAKDRMQQKVLMTTGSHHMQYYWFKAPWIKAERDDAGRASFNQYCSGCHGEDGGDSRNGLFNKGLGIENIKYFQESRYHDYYLPEISEKDFSQASRFMKRIQFPGGIIMFPFAWLIKDQKWIHDEYTYLQQHPEAEEFETYGNHWNNNCDSCHSTAAQYGYDKAHQIGQSHIVELGISCESCHGPAKKHTEYYQNPINRLASQGKGAHIVNPAKIDSKRSSEVCGRCHGNFSDKKGVSSTFLPGEKLSKWATPDDIDEDIDDWQEQSDDTKNTFWPDGTVFVAGRDYLGLLKTACYTKGELSCVSCHQMHGSDPEDQLKKGARKSEQCFSCHKSYKEDISAHTFHKEDSSGSNCVNCHMPYTTWGLLKANRSHRIDSPDVLMSTKHGRPNACNLCHLDKSIKEVAENLSSWYGKPMPAELFKEDKKDLERSAAVNWLLKGHAFQRALTSWHMGWGTAQKTSGKEWFVPFLALSLMDDYHAVRYRSLKSLLTFPYLKKIVTRIDSRKKANKKVIEEIISLWQEKYDKKGLDHILIKENGEFDLNRASDLLKDQDKSEFSVDE